MAEQTFAPARRGRDNSLYSEEAVHSFSTFLTKFPDPDDMLVKAGLTRASLRVLEYDDEVAQCIDTRREALIATPWRMEPQQSRASKRIHELLEPHAEDIIRGAFDAVLYGYSVQEAVYTRTGQGIGIESISAKPIEWFYLRADGVLMYRSMVKGEDIECDLRKYLLTRRQPSYRQPYGESLLTRIYWTAFFKGHGRKFWAKFLERFGEPLLVGKVADQEKFVKDVAALGLAAGLPVQKDDTVESIAVTQSGEFERFENALTRSIQKMVLGQTLTSDVGSTGSFAAAKVHDQVRQDKRNADIRLVTRTMQGLVDTLCALNGWGTPPKFVMADGTGLERERAERDKILVESGMLKLTKDYLMDRYDFEEGDFEIVDTPETPATPLPANEPVADEEMAARIIAMRPAKQVFTPQQQAIEDGVDDLMIKVPEPINMEAMLAAVKAATDPADLAVRLSLLLDQQDPRFTELLARAQFAAQTLGYVVSEQESPKPTKQPAPSITMSMPEQQPQIINVTVQPSVMPTPIVNVAAPNQPAPIVNVEVAAPNVTIEPAQVNVEASLPAPEITITMPPRKTVTEIERDADGNIVRAEQTEVDQ
jgi:hypothetical protein